MHVYIRYLKESTQNFISRRTALKQNFENHFKMKDRYFYDANPVGGGGWGFLFELTFLPNAFISPVNIFKQANCMLAL